MLISMHDGSCSHTFPFKQFLGGGVFMVIWLRKHLQTMTLVVK